MDTDRIQFADQHGLVVRDAYPVSTGHTLIISRRHIGSFFELSIEEQSGLLTLLTKAKEELDATLRPDAYNVGINDGGPAGQTIPHVHMHLIPRYAGDASDPRGGVRWLFPEKAKYWA